MPHNKPAMITGLVDEWKLRSAQAKDRLRLKYLPVDFDISRVDEYERYLSMSDVEQRTFVADMSNDEFEFWCALETARALYVDPADKRDGSITLGKVARHPDRYRWNKD